MLSPERSCLTLGLSGTRANAWTEAVCLLHQLVGERARHDACVAHVDDVPRDVLFEAKQLGYSDAQLANLYLGKISTETILKVRVSVAK